MADEAEQEEHGNVLKSETNEWDKTDDSWPSIDRKVGEKMAGH